MERIQLVNLVTDILASAALVLQIGLLLFLLALGLRVFINPVRSGLSFLGKTLRGAEVYLAAGVATVAMSGSLFFSEYAHYAPCGLCWYQRIMMYPLAIILIQAAIRRDLIGAVRYGVPLAVIGSLVSIYHIYIEYNPEQESAVCKAGGAASCAVKWINELGYITIPVLALTAFLAIITLLMIGRRNNKPAN